MPLNVAKAAALRTLLERSLPVQRILAPEGEHIVVFNPAVIPWVSGKLTAETIRAVQTRLSPHLQITLNARGFAPAAARTEEGEKDATNYDAIWVRDNVWAYYGLLADSSRRDDARSLLLALWDYYATDAQVGRFRAVIDNPKLAQDQMAVPHIRFDGTSEALSDVMIDGRPEKWNHRQIDAHGLFFAAIGEAFENNLLKVSDFTKDRLRILMLFPLFLRKIDFASYEDAGPWEEINRKNSSSIGLATRALQVWRRILYEDKSSALDDLRCRINRVISAGKEGEVFQQWSRTALDELIENGLRTVKQQIQLGGESPDYSPENLHFRRADAALLFLIEPAPLAGLEEEELRTLLLLIDTLRRPCGVLRYRNDSYQGGNYWIKEPDAEGPALTADASGRESFLHRLRGLPPDSEAQWFFDSLLVLARLRLANITFNQRLAKQDRHFAALHLKRALGQITGPGLVAADGMPVRPWLPPESINTVIIDGRRYELPSPITPLNWAKAGLSLALEAYANFAHS